MEIKLDLGSDANTKEIVESALKKTILAGAVNSILGELTPERMEVFVSRLLDRSLGEVIDSWELKKLLQKEVEPVYAAIVSSASTKLAIHNAVEAGVKKAIENLPDQITKLFESRVATLFTR